MKPVLSAASACLAAILSGCAFVPASPATSEAMHPAGADAGVTPLARMQRLEGEPAEVAAPTPADGGQTDHGHHHHDHHHHHHHHDHGGGQ